MTLGNLSSLLLLLIFSLSKVLITNGLSGFTANLVHREYSPLSPFYNPNMSYFDRLHTTFLRSLSRTNHFNPKTQSFKSKFESKIIPASGEYLMNISIGTPPIELLGIADTGSDLIWTQCEPCTQCFKQNPPLFNPKKSSSFKNIPCESNFCTKLMDSSCGDENDTCQYHYSYGDRSFTKGNLASETINIGSASSSSTKPVSILKVVFGCGYENGGTFDESGSGLVGLGGGSLSLISQITKLIEGKFSYCLVPLNDQSNVTSKIRFGKSSILSGSSVVSTPLVTKDPYTFYYLTLEGISVGKKRLVYENFKSSSSSSSSSSKALAASEGNIVIDSGTTLTFLPSGFHEDLVSALEEAINAERVSDPRGVLSLCFKADDGIEPPIITAHFTGADVILQPLNSFVKVEDGLFCFTMEPSNDVAIFGNLAQMNFLVGYDLHNKIVSFKPADCSKH